MATVCVAATGLQYIGDNPIRSSIRLESMACCTEPGVRAAVDVTRCIRIKDGRVGAPAIGRVITCDVYSVPAKSLVTIGRKFNRRNSSEHFNSQHTRGEACSGWIGELFPAFDGAELASGDAFCVPARRFWSCQIWRTQNRDLRRSRLLPSIPRTHCDVGAQRVQLRAPNIGSLASNVTVSVSNQSSNRCRSNE